MATFIPARGEQREVTPANGVTFTKEELNTLLGGGYGLYTIPGDETHLILARDLAAFDGLPRNDAASSRTVDSIYGDVLIVADAELGQSN